MIALTRKVPASIAHCELTHIDRQPIDVTVARAQHEQYERALEAAGCTVHHLPVLDDHADSVFVEDTVVAVDEVAVISRPGAESRRGETDSMRSAIAAFRELHE